MRAARYRVRGEIKRLKDRRKVAIIKVAGRIDDKSDCLKEFRQAGQAARERTDLLGVIVNLQDCSSVGESGFGVIGQLIKTMPKVAFILGSEKSQPTQKLHILKFDSVAVLCETEEQATNAIISTTEE